MCLNRLFAANNERVLENQPEVCLTNKSSVACLTEMKKQTCSNLGLRVQVFTGKKNTLSLNNRIGYLAK